MRQNEEDAETDNEDEILSLFNESQMSDGVIDISDVPIFKVNKVEEGTEQKPIGSAYILIKMSVNEAPELRVNA